MPINATSWQKRCKGGFDKTPSFAEKPEVARLIHSN